MPRLVKSLSQKTLAILNPCSIPVSIHASKSLSMNVCCMKRVEKNIGLAFLTEKIEIWGLKEIICRSHCIFRASAVYNGTTWPKRAVSVENTP